MEELYEVALVRGDSKLLAMLVTATLNDTLRDIIPVPAIKFDLREMHPAKARFRFRFKPDEILTIHAKLRLPDVLYTAQRCPNSSLEALCIVLARLTCPCRWQELVELFGRNHAVLCSVFLDMIDMLYRKVNTRMSFDIAMIERHGPATARAGFERTGGLKNCVGFIDGTVRPTCRPKTGQRVAYNGHKRVHAIKFQSIVLANGLIVSLTGPVEGRRHDVALLKMSSVAELMKTKFPQYCVYGDPAYPVKTWIQAPYKGNNLTEAQLEYNKRTSKMRVCVEWMFGVIGEQWKFLDFKKNLKILLSPIATFYVIAAWLTNCLICTRGRSPATMKFGTELPSINEYLGE